MQHHPRNPVIALLAIGSFWLSGFAGDLAGQDPMGPLGESWRWRRFDTEDGLSSNSISALYQDRYDNVYAATNRGLCRYNLFEWNALENVEPFDGGAVTRFVEGNRALYAVSETVLWQIDAGTAIRPIYRGGGLHAATNDLEEVYLIDQDRKAHLLLSGEKVERIAADVQLPAGDVLGYEVDPNQVHWLAMTAGLYSRDMSLDVWQRVYSRDLGAKLIDLRCLRFFVVERLESGPPVPVRGSPGDRASGSGGAPHREFWGLFRDPEDPASGNRLARLEEGMWRSVATFPGRPVESLVLDADHNYYATLEDGRLFFSADGREWKHKAGLEDALRGGLLDSSGALWFRTGTGAVASYDPRSQTWTRIPSGTGESFPNVYSIMETESGEIWMGMTEGVSRYREGEEPKIFESGMETPLEDITGLAEDGRGYIWISSKDSFNGALYFDPQSKNEKWGKGDQRGFEDHPIHRIVRDPKEELWFLSGERRPDVGWIMYRLSLRTAFSLTPVAVSHGPVNDLARTRQDAFWLATDDGLLRGTMSGETFQLEERFTDRDGLLSLQVWSVTEGPHGGIWVGYLGTAAGVTRLKDGVATSFQEKGGLASPIVWSITVSGPNVWFGTALGLSRFDDESWYSYPVASEANRVVSPVFASKRERGSILVGTLGRGALRFRLDDWHRPKFTHRDLTDPVPADGNVTFSWDARDYRNRTLPENLLFRSRIDEESWTPTSDQRSRKFTGLSPGRHTFEVEVRDLAGNRNREEVVHRFRVGDRPGSRFFVAALGLAAAVLVSVLGAWVYRKRTRMQLRWSRYRGLFEGYPGAVFLLDSRGRVVEYNGAFPLAVGLENTLRKDILHRPLELFPVFYAPDVRQLIQTVLAGKATQLEGHRFSSSTTSERVLQLKAIPLSAAPRPGVLGAVVIVEDRTLHEEEQRDVECERRLLSLRQLSRRVGAEFGEALRVAVDDAAVQSNAHLLDRLRHAAVVAEKLTAFAGKPAKEGVVNRTSVNELVERLLGGSGSGKTSPSGSGANSRDLPLAGKVRVDHRGQMGLWDVALQEPLLEEVIHEIFRNSFEAMPEEGVLTVRTRNVRIDEDRGALEPGSYVEIQVKDTGAGIEKSVLPQIFEPFYSTKPDSRALGIGLSLAYGVVRACGGELRVESQVAMGTTVCVLLPAVR